MSAHGQSPLRRANTILAGSMDERPALACDSGSVVVICDSQEARRAVVRGLVTAVDLQPTEIHDLGALLQSTCASGVRVVLAALAERPMDGESAFKPISRLRELG